MKSHLREMIDFEFPFQKNYFHSLQDESEHQDLSTSEDDLLYEEFTQNLDKDSESFEDICEFMENDVADEQTVVALLHCQ